MNHASGIWVPKEYKIAESIQNRAAHSISVLHKFAKGDMGWIPESIR